MKLLGCRIKAHHLYLELAMASVFAPLDHEELLLVSLSSDISLD